MYFVAHHIVAGKARAMKVYRMYTAMVIMCVVTFTHSQQGIETGTKSTLILISFKNMVLRTSPIMFFNVNVLKLDPGALPFASFHPFHYIIWWNFYEYTIYIHLEFWKGTVS